MKLVLLGLGISSCLWAYDFSAADQQFMNRGQGETAVKAAIASYNSIDAAALTAEESIYIAEQVSALHLYWGYIVNQQNTQLRQNIANGCIQTINKIESTSSAAFYYWRAACQMARANASGVMASLSEAAEVLGFINAGRDIDPSYEGGGFDRLSGVLYSKLPSLNPWGPTGDMNRALRDFRRAIDSSAYLHPLNPTWRDGDSETGDLFYSTYYYFADALMRNDQRAEARSMVEAALADIDAGRVARGREPETAVAKANLQGLLRRL